MKNKRFVTSLIASLGFVTQLSFAQPDKVHDLSGGPELSRVWVEFAPQRADRARQALDRAGAKIHHEFGELGAFAVSVPTAALAGLSRNPNIVAIEDDPKRYPTAQTVPYGIDAVQARAVWDADTDGAVDAGAPTGSGIQICIIDSGLSIVHEDMNGVNVVGGYPASYNNDTCGHGTHVAGTIAAANNGVGVVGVSPGAASLYIVKVFDGPSCGWSYSSDLVDAANRCGAAGSNIISMSLGGTRRSRNEDRAFSNLDKDGILSIAAAGNDGNTRNSYPASYDSVVSVAAVNSGNVVADFSQQNAAVELAAPGVGVLSTVPFISTNTLVSGGSTISGNKVEYAADGSATGTIVDGGLCDGVGSWSGDIVLCERGSISFFDKVSNVATGGGVAAVIYNNEPGGLSATLGEGNSSSIPAIGLSQADGSAAVVLVGNTGTVESTALQAGSGYEAWDGTSMATPHVSGVAALIWSSSPNSSNDDVRNALTSSALDLGVAGRDSAYGYGLVQANDAWAVLGGGSGPSNQLPTASFTDACNLLDCTFDGSGSEDPDGSIVSYEWKIDDVSAGNNVMLIHGFSAAGTYSVSLTVTDNSGGKNTEILSVTVSDGNGSGGGDTEPPVISDVGAAKTKGNSFEITWTTNEPATSTVTINGQSFSDSALVTEHAMAFRGSKGASYSYTVSSKDAAGNESTSGPYTYEN